MRSNEESVFENELVVKPLSIPFEFIGQYVKDMRNNIYFI